MEEEEEEDEGNDDDDEENDEDDDDIEMTEDARQTVEDIGDSPLKISQGSKSKGKGKKERQKALKLPSDAASDVIEWLRGNEILYNRGKEEYLEGDKKMDLWAEKAAEMSKRFPGLDITAARLHKWYTSQRDMYVKLKNRLEKSGSGSRRLTDHQEWLMKVFPFIDKHVFPKSGRQASMKVSLHYLLKVQR